MDTDLPYSTPETSAPSTLHYAMDNKGRGKAIIINNKTFGRVTGKGPRRESDVDAASLYTIFKSRGFDVKLCNDKTVAQMETLFKECKHSMQNVCLPWWRHHMETFSALLAICAEISPVTAQRPVTRSFDVFFNLRLKKPLSRTPMQKQDKNDEIYPSVLGLVDPHPRWRQLSTVAQIIDNLTVYSTVCLEQWSSV